MQPQINARPASSASSNGARGASSGGLATLGGSALSWYLITHYGVPPEIAIAAGTAAGGVVAGIGATLGSVSRDLIHERGERMTTLGRVLAGIGSRLG